MQVEQIEDLSPYLADLTDILVASVAAGASIGFLPQLAREEAENYWLDVQKAVNKDRIVLLLAIENGKAYGTVQLVPCLKGNAEHRAEVHKLMVGPRSRRHGIGHRLMAALEHTAWEIGRTLLILDTRRGDVADGLYGRMGYTRFGIVPAFTIDSDGTSHDTCFFYKHLTPAK
ncbi:GNAT family N-acetyltransferase [Kordiimonas aestuarii]|uniref:GNAT family N-acetyltransferase n=1 Tax=Kordiimonas aestuarii TaxID=1005925 RepID=UPI0021D3DB99|nr:GNAT family N-acetyltransferase [Kordiimonas aestuarii]